MSDVKRPAAKERSPYSSPVRESGARQTRQAILTAARSLILAEGYGAASVSRIAEAAGVARPTVTAVFGSKPALMNVLVDEALAGDDEPGPVAQRPWFQPVWDARTLEQLTEAYAQACTLIGSRTALIFDSLGRATESSAELAALWDTINGNRRLGAAMVVRHGISTGALDTGALDTGALDAGALGADAAVEPLVDALWVLNDPALYRSLVLACGWAENTYTRWLARQMYASLVSPPVPDQK
jgi:AcrR family transcriptional regulator